MKMVKSLLLGSAAGLVAVAGAQAADLPVKAKPVEYVKICSIYGAGFFYIPGTDTCIKIGGWVRAEYALGETGNSHAQFMAGGGGRNNRIDSTDTRFRARTVISLDVRTQTEYGTVRAYNRFGFTADTRPTTSGGVLYTERAFIQIAGFTFGKTQSYFDFVGGAVCYGCGYGGHLSQYGAGGTLVFAYSATLGNGFTATHRARRRHRSAAPRSGMPRTTRRTRSSIGAIPGPIAAGSGRRHHRRRVDRRLRARTRCPTSSARCVSTRPGARRRSLRRRTSSVAAGTATTRPAPARTARRSSAPEDTFGFAVDAGVIVNLPWAKGDRFYVEGAYSEGAPVVCRLVRRHAGRLRATSTASTAAPSAAA